jgi:hypothetical protein
MFSLFLIDGYLYGKTPISEREKMETFKRQILFGSGIYMFIKWKLQR